MRTSQYFLPTLKETPADAELISHKLMLRAGMIRKLASGLYTWLPMGLRVLAKVENIVREELNKVNALEILMPLVQPAELWQASQRWDLYGKELLKFPDRHERSFCLGPTHEEVITDLMKNEIRSYKDLPKVFFQIATKFRDEIRPRFGVMRAREFLMKDAYSFNIDQDSLDQTYAQMFSAYEKIFTRIGLQFRAVLADTGSIGGSKSHEFQVLADSGEDEIAYSDQSDYAANVELAQTTFDPPARDQSNNPMSTIDTPGLYTIQALVKKFNMDIKKTIKTLIVTGSDGGLVALILRGDHELNPLKAEKHPKIASPLQFAEKEAIFDAIGAHPGSLGPVGLPLEMIVDHAAAAITDFSCGANQDDVHYINVNWDRDAALNDVFDLRCVAAGDPSPDGKGTLSITRGIEVGHIFQLGDKYSQTLNANVLDQQGKSQTLQMGCYGIGISRIVAASIEQNHDQHGIIWPEAIAPFQIGIIPIQMHKSTRVREACEKLYQDLTDAEFEVLFDDRNERPGVMFSNLDLLGIPHRIVVSERGLDAGTIEYKARHANEITQINQARVIDFFNNS